MIAIHFFFMKVFRIWQYIKMTIFLVCYLDRKLGKNTYIPQQ